MTEIDARAARAALDVMPRSSSDEINTERNGGKSPRSSGDSPVSGGADLAAERQFSRGRAS